MENLSDERVYYWEGYWAHGLVQDERWVGGWDNLATSTQGWERHQLDAGEIRRYPTDNQGFGWWHGTMDTLGCHRNWTEERRPVTPGTYVAIVSFPVGEDPDIASIWDQGAQDRVEIRIVP